MYAYEIEIIAILNVRRPDYCIIRVIVSAALIIMTNHIEICTEMHYEQRTAGRSTQRDEDAVEKGTR